MTDITDEQFDALLRELVNQNPASYLLGIPWVYEIVAEEYNNEVLALWEQRQEDSDD